MLVQHEWLRYIKELEADVANARDRISHYDEKPRKMYEDSIDPNEHNLFIRAWSELSEEQKDVWRWKALET